MTPPSSKPSSSFETIPSYDNYLLNLQSHFFPYRSPRPLTPPSLPPAPVYLSCWWSRDLTDFWGHFLETTLPRFSELLSSLCQRGNGKPTTAPMTQWREQFKKKKIVDPLFPLSNQGLLAHRLPILYQHCSQPTSPAGLPNQPVSPLPIKPSFSPGTLLKGHYSSSEK